MPKKIDPLLVDKAIELYVTGLSALDAGAQVGISESVILRQVKIRGINHTNELALGKSQVDKIIELYNIGQSPPQIAKLVGCESSTCLRHLKKAGIFVGRRILEERQKLVDIWKCSNCLIVKAIGEFQKRGGPATERCYDCDLLYEKELREKPHNKVANKARTAEVKQRIRDYVNQQKIGPCVDCGQTYESFAMEFDHVGDDKIMSISAMVTRHWNIDKIQEEIQKCELICVLCHRTRTFARGQHWEPTTTIKPEKIKQQRRRKMIGDWLKKYKSTHSCVDCAQIRNWTQMDFDHLPGTIKKGSVGNMNSNMKALLSEIEKCELVCALCHRRRTYLRNEYGHRRERGESDYKELMRQKRQAKEERNDKIVELYKTKSCKEVAKLVNMSGFGVKMILISRGVGIRGIAEAKQLQSSKHKESENHDSTK